MQKGIPICVSLILTTLKTELRSRTPCWPGLDRSPLV